MDFEDALKQALAKLTLVDALTHICRWAMEQEERDPPLHTCVHRVLHGYLAPMTLEDWVQLHDMLGRAMRDTVDGSSAWGTLVEARRLAEGAGVRLSEGSSPMEQYAAWRQFLEERGPTGAR